MTSCATTTQKMISRVGGRLLGLLACCWLDAFSAHAEVKDPGNAPVDMSERSVLRGYRPAWATAKNDLGAVASEMMLEHMTLGLRRSPARQRALEEFLQELQRPSSTRFHRWLTPAQVGAQFGHRRTTWIR